MLNYIQAEFYRLVRNKKNYYIYLVLAVLFIILLFLAANPTENFVITINGQSGDFSFSFLYFTMGVTALIVGGIIGVGAQSFYTIYLEDFSNRMLPSVLSTGLTKWQYTLSKVISHAIYSTIVMALATLMYIGGFFIFEHFIDDVVIDWDHIQFFALLSVLITVTIVAYVVIAYAFSLFFQRSDMAIFLYFILANGWLSTLAGFIGRIDALSFIGTVNEYTLSDRMTVFTNEVIAAASPETLTAANLLTDSFYATLWTALAYIPIGILLTILFFRFIEIKE